MYRRGKCPLGEIAARGNVGRGIVQSGKCPVGEMSGSRYKHVINVFCEMHIIKMIKLFLSYVFYYEFKYSLPFNKSLTLWYM